MNKEEKRAMTIQRLVSLILTAVLLLASVSVAMAEEPKEDKPTLMTCRDWQYAVSKDGGAELRSYCGHGGEIMIPDELDGHPITAVKENPFADLKETYTLVVSENHPYLAVIDGMLFGKTDHRLISYPKGRTGDSCAVPEGTETIGAFAFAFCNLHVVMLPESVTSIEKGAFSKCNFLELITLPDSLTSIGEDAFYHCESLRAVTIPDGVTSIGRFAFNRCSALASVTLPNSITSIGDRTFESCYSLHAVTIPDSVTSIGDSAFCRCNSLQAVTIPDSVTSIGDRAFYFCDSLRAVTIPDGVTSIGRYVFYSCRKMTSVTIPDSVTSIGQMAFDGCTGLAELTIPDSVTSIAESAFDYCPNLILTVTAGSDAETYCQTHGLNYVTADTDGK